MFSVLLAFALQQTASADPVDRLYLCLSDAARSEAAAGGPAARIAAALQDRCNSEESAFRAAFVARQLQQGHDRRRAEADSKAEANRLRASLAAAAAPQTRVQRATTACTLQIIAQAETSASVAESEAAFLDCLRRVATLAGEAKR